MSHKKRSLTKEAKVKFALMKLTRQVRAELRSKYNIYDAWEYKDYRGLCDEATISLAHKVIAYNWAWIFGHDIKVSTHGIHGELRHDSRIDSMVWNLEHTMLVAKIDNMTFYIDATSQQFREFYHDHIPYYYVGRKCPNWFYPDKFNPLWNNKLIQWIDKRIQITHTPLKHKTGIITYLDYYIYGAISDKIHNIRYK